MDTLSTVSGTPMVARTKTYSIREPSELSTLSSTDHKGDESDIIYDRKDLWLDDDKEETSVVMMSALQQFGAQMLKLSKGLQKINSSESIR